MAYQSVIIVWNYGDSSEGFRCLPPSVSSFIENNYKTNRTKDEFIDLTELNLSGCFINLKRMIIIKDAEVNFTLKRSLHRMHSTAANGVRWQLQGRSGRWSDYSIEFCDELEQARDAGNVQVRKDDKYEIDLLKMLQVDAVLNTKSVRRVCTDLKYSDQANVVLPVSELCPSMKINAGGNFNDIKTIKNVPLLNGMDKAYPTTRLVNRKRNNDNDKGHLLVSKLMRMNGSRDNTDISESNHNINQTLYSSSFYHNNLFNHTNPFNHNNPFNHTFTKFQPFTHQSLSNQLLLNQSLPITKSLDNQALFNHQSESIHNKQITIHHQQQQQVQQYTNSAQRNEHLQQNLHQQKQQNPILKGQQRVSLHLPLQLQQQYTHTPSNLPVTFMQATKPLLSQKSQHNLSMHQLLPQLSGTEQSFLPTLQAHPHSQRPLQFATFQSTSYQPLQPLQQSYWDLKIPYPNLNPTKLSHPQSTPLSIHSILPNHLPRPEKIFLEDLNPYSFDLCDPKCFEFLLSQNFMRPAQQCPDDICPICLENLQSESPYSPNDLHHQQQGVLFLNNCHHHFHHLCLKTMYQNGNKDGSIQCPQCKSIHGTKHGNCPAGLMEVMYRKGKLPGHPDTRFIIDVSYIVFNGIQSPNHPNPGLPFTTLGFPRHCFLPGTAKGLKVLKLLKKAWKRRLIFTIGTSATTGADNTVIWNEIHHKTEILNTRGHGYPDPNYLDNVLEELASQGVVEEEERGGEVGEEKAKNDMIRSG